MCQANLVPIGKLPLLLPFQVAAVEKTPLESAFVIKTHPCDSILQDTNDVMILGDKAN